MSVTSRSDESVVQTYLRVDGMHSVTCERYLESVAESRDGVVAATASYVSETIRVDHDPSKVDEKTLCETLSTLGYSAHPRTDETDGSGPRANGDPRNERGLEDLLGYRYAAGVLFGAFLMLPYVAILYPAHLSSYLDGGLFSVFDGAISFQGSGGLLLAQLFLVLTAVILFFTGMPILRGAYAGLKIRRPNTDLLVAMTIVAAYVYSAIAAVIGRSDIFFDVTIVVGAVVVAAIFYESLLKQRALDRITELTAAQITEARRIDPGGTSTIPVEALEPGDRVLVRSGERIPVDGVVDGDACTVDEAIVTGESLPSRKWPGDTVVGGSTVTDGATVIAVDDEPTSRIDRLVGSVWDIQSAEHGSQRRANAIAAIVGPAVLALALIAGVGTLVLGAPVVPATLTALAVVLVASPWGLGLATPLSVAAGVRTAMERGIIVFDETVFERLRDVDIVVFDKTGTLTTGEMEIVETDAPPDLLTDVATLERRSSHPAARAIADAFGEGSCDGDPPSDGGECVSGDDRHGIDRGDQGNEPDKTDVAVTDFESHGNGVEGVVDGQNLLVGNEECFVDRGWSVDDAIREHADEARTAGDLPVIVGRDGAAEGIVTLRDGEREGVDETLTRLAGRGREIVILTGDDPAAAERFDDHPAVDAVYAGVPPEGKTATVRCLQAASTVLMVGDGTNDAPALAQADAGMTLGGGTAIATDAADVALATVDPRAVVTAIELAGAVSRRTAENTGLALIYNVIAIPLLLAGLLNPVFVTFAVVLTMGVLAGNSWRSLLNA